MFDKELLDRLKSIYGDAIYKRVMVYIAERGIPNYLSDNEQQIWLLNKFNSEERWTRNHLNNKERHDEKAQLST